jgi:transcriptional/translational regulatory protein YebC/TACO1
MFEKQGQILIDNEEEELDEEQVMEDALEAGASDFAYEDGIFDIRTEANDLNTVRDALEEKGYSFVQAEVAYIPATYTSLTDEHDRLMMSKLIENFEDDDDVQNVWHNWENPDDE